MQFAARAERSCLLRKANFKMVSKLQHPSTFWFLSDFRLEKAFPGLEHRRCRGWAGRHKTVPVARRGDVDRDRFAISATALRSGAPQTVVRTNSAARALRMKAYPPPATAVRG
jgi:hypothetical protein